MPFLLLSDQHICRLVLASQPSRSVDSAGTNTFQSVPSERCDHSCRFTYMASLLWILSLLIGYVGCNVIFFEALRRLLGPIERIVALNRDPSKGHVVGLRRQHQVAY